MTDKEVDEALARAEAATLGPWYVGNTGKDDPAWVELDPYDLESDKDERVLCQVFTGGSKIVADAEWDEGGRLQHGEPQKRNAAFIAHARTDVPALVAALTEARALLREALADIEDVEWSQIHEVIEKWSKP